MTIDEKVKDIYKYSSEKNDWLTKESNDYVEKHIGNMIEYSKRIKKSCKEYGIKYLDNSKNFIHVLDTAIDYLLK
jgi:hypothetical protein